MSNAVKHPRTYTIGAALGAVGASVLEFSTTGVLPISTIMAAVAAFFASFSS